MRSRGSTVYRFGDYTLDVEEHRLKRGDRNLPLPPKTFKTLVYLVRRHGHLVTKRELLDQLWVDVIVTENALTRRIQEVREALGDDARDPCYVQTIPRVGYKFIAEVEEITSAETEEAEVEEEYTAMRVRVTEEGEAAPMGPWANGRGQVLPAAVSPTLPDAHTLTRTRRWTLIGALTLLGLVALVIVWYATHWRKPSIAFAERDWALVADFDNRTGEEVFDVALRTALERELSRSRYVNIVPQGRVFDTLTLMRRSLDTKLTEAVAREVCLRDGGIRVLLGGSIQEIGGVYAITVKLVDPSSGVTVTSLGEEADGRPYVLRAIRRLAQRVRETLGESLARIGQSEQHLERVTTPSLQALAFYSKGWNFANRFDWERARLFFQQAIDRDPGFAMGYLGLGYAHLWLGQVEEGRASFGRAAALADQVTDREKCFILGSHAAYGVSDLRRAIENYELLVQLYPDDFWGQENLSWAYLMTGDWRRSVEHKRACVRIRPHYAINHSDLGIIALFTEGDVEKAHTEFSRALALNLDLPFGLAHLSPAFRDWMRGDIVQAEAKLSTFLSAKMAVLTPYLQIMGRWWPARFCLFTGKFEAALEQLETSVALARQQGNANLAQWSELELGLTHWELGDREQFESLMRNVAADSVGLARAGALGWLGVSRAQSGRATQARHLHNELQKEARQMPVDITHPPLPGELNRAKRAFSAQIEGEIALAQGAFDEAIQHFQRVIDLVPPSQRPFMTALDPQLYLAAHESLAHAYEQRRQWDAAIRAYEAILAHKVLTITVPATSPIYVRTLWSISQALEKTGEAEKAAAYREQFRRLWPGKPTTTISR